MKIIINRLWFLGFLWVFVVFGCEDQGDSVIKKVDLDLSEDQGDSVIKKVDVDLSEMGNFEVGVTTLIFVDEDRGTPPNQEFLGEDHRTLVTEVWYPMGDDNNSSASDIILDSASCPYPLVIFSHGFMAFRNQSTIYTKHLASHGYIVAAPDYVLSNFSAPGGPTPKDILNQPGDISFIMDEFIRFSSEEVSPFYGCIDESSIGVSGHSLGGLTTLLATFHADVSDPRIKASVPISPFACPFEEDFFSNREVPLFLISGGNDIFVVFQSHLEGPFERARPPKYLMEVIGGTHTGFTDFNIPETGSFDFLQSFVTTELDVTDDLFEIFNQMGDMEKCGYSMDSMIPQVDVDQLGPEIDPDIQREMLNIYATAFFNIYLKGDKSFEYFFTDDFMNSTPEVRINYVP